MPLENSHSTDTPKSESGNGWEGIERTAMAPESPPERKSPLPPLKYTNKKWYVYDSQFGYFRQHEDNYISHMVQKMVGDLSSFQIQDTVSRIRYASHYLGKFYPAIRFDNTDILHNVLNGITRVKLDGSHSLENHDPKWCFGGVLPVNYDFNTDCPTFIEELRTKLPDLLDQRVILLFGAYCLIPDCRFGISLFNYGPSHTGKSTIVVHGLGSVFGAQTCYLKLSEICPESYTGLSHVPALVNKLLNIGAEIDGREVRDTTNFKRLISGESVIAREAYERGGEIQTCCKLTFNMNELPKINGTEAEIERIRLVLFNHVTESDQRDFSIEQKIKLEGSGVYMLLLNQMSEALKLNVFPFGSGNSKDVFEQLKQKIDPYKHFMEAYKDELELGPWMTHTMDTNELDPFIIDFLRSNNYENIFHIETFKRRLYARFNIQSGDQQWRPQGIPRNKQHRVTVLHGIRKLN